MKHAITMAVVGGGAIFLVGHAPASDAIFRTVALSGTPAPGLSTVFFDAVSDPRINPSGEVLFWARLTGGNTTTNNNGSLWWDRGGPLALLLRESDPSPTGPGDFITGIPTASWDDASRIALAASFNVPGGGTQTTRLAALRETPTGELIARLTEAVNAYNLPALIPLAASGEGAIWNTVSRDNDITFISEAARNISNATPVPGAGGIIPAGATFRQLSAPGMSSAGRTVFRAAAGTTNITADWKYALFTDRAGPLSLLGVVGGQVPGAPDGQIFREFSNEPVINASGSVAYWARIEGSGAPAGSDTAIFVDAPGATLRALARAGDPAPGTTLAAFAGFARRVALSDSGDAAFIGYLLGGGATNTTNSGIWVWNPSLAAAHLLAREGGAAPGTANAVFSGFGDVRLGPDGQVAFLASLAGPGVTQQTSAALFATDRSGVLRQVARIGEGFDVPGVDQRVTRQIVFDHDQAGFPQMNAAGELALKLTFTDNSHGVFVASLPCFGDFNNDHAIDGADIAAFFAAWENNLPAADCNLDGSIDGADVEAFFLRWEAGTC